MRHFLSTLFVLAACGACGGGPSGSSPVGGAAGDAATTAPVAPPAAPQASAPAAPVAAAAPSAGCFSRFPQGETVRALAADGAGGVLAVGLPGVALRFDGSAWSASCLPDPVALAAVWASGPADAWAAGEQAVYRWNGGSWARVNLGVQVAGPFVAVWGSSASDVWLLAEDAAVHFDGQGFRRFGLDDMRSLGFPFGAFREVWGTGPADVWIAAERGTLHWDGTAWWASLAAPEQHLLRSAFASSAREAWAVGVSLDGGGVAWRYDGQAWRQEPWPGAPLLGSVRGAGGSVFFQGAGDLLERRGGVTRSLAPPVAPSGAPLVASATDLWLPDARGVARWDGATWTRSLEVPR